MSKGMYVPKESQPKQGGGTSKARDGEKGGKRKIVAQNKKARHDYAIIDTYEAGIVLTGTEVKSLREGRTSLTDGFVQIDRGEAWLHNAHIPEYHQGTWTNHSVRRKRKLLLHREEIDKLESKSQETGHTIVPLALYFKQRPGEGRDRPRARQEGVRQAADPAREAGPAGVGPRDRGGEAEAAGRVARRSAASAARRPEYGGIVAALFTYDGTAPHSGCSPRRRDLKKQHGDDRFRQRLSKQGKRVEEAAMISLTICRNQ